MDLVTVYGVLVAIVAALLVYIQLMETQKESAFGNLLAQYRLEHSNINDQLADLDKDDPMKDAWLQNRTMLMMQYREVHNTDRFFDEVEKVIKYKAGRKIKKITVGFVKLIEWNTFFYKAVFGLLVPNTNYKTDIGNARLLITLLFVVLVTLIAVTTPAPDFMAELKLHRFNVYFAIFLGVSTALIFARLMFHHSIIQKEQVSQWKDAAECIRALRVDNFLPEA